MNWLDKAIGWFAPQTGFRRSQYRRAMTHALRYDGADSGRRTSGWTTAGTSANSEIGPGLSKLRERSRDLVRNNPYAARAIDEIVGQAIGTGIAAQARSQFEPLNQKIDEAWAAWSDECDADGQLDFGGIQDLVARTVLESGEALIRFRPRFAADGFRVPLQLQVIEPDFLDIGKTEKTKTGYIIQGVEFDLVGRRIFYWIFPEHPGDVISTSLRGNFASQRAPASEIVHIYRKKRPGQVRGVPLLAPVMLALRDLDEYQDAERVRKKIEACLTAFIAQPEGGDGPTLGSTTTETGGKRIEEFRPGMVMYGAAGEKAEFFAPTGAGGYAEYVRQNERVIAAGIGMTYEQLTGDLSNVNYSSHKAGRLSFQAQIEALRWLCLIPGFLRPVRERFIDAAFASGAIPQQMYETEYTPPAFGSVDPKKDADAVETDLRTGRKTWPQAISEMGYDPRKQLAEIEKWRPLLEAAGVSFAGSVGSSKNEGGDNNGDGSKSPSAK